MIKLKALIVLNGNILDLNVLEKAGKESDFILCADGGTDHCLKASLMPDMIIGDLDSISKDSLKVIYDNKIPIEKFPVKKDATDSELSIDYLISKKFTDITLVGAMGNRMDHTLSNILLLSKLHEKGIKGKIIDESNTIYMVDEELVLTKEEDSYVSVIPITNLGAIITLKGFEYKLDKVKIKFGSTYGISNKIIGDKAHVIVHEGACLVFVSKD